MITSAVLHSKVRALLNEAEDSTAISLLTYDTRSLDDHIAMLMPDAVLFVQKSKGWGMLNPKLATDIVIDECKDGVCTFSLPDDFVSLVSLQMNGWLRPCRVLFPPSSVVAAMQGNRYTRAGCCKPVCVEEVSPSGSRIVRCFSLPSDSEPSVTHFVYEARYNPDEGLSGNDEALHLAVAYRCAGMLYALFERHDNANSLFAIAATYCNSPEPKKDK